jgi:AAA family ATP:ADP antiporter
MSRVENTLKKLSKPIADEEKKNTMLSVLETIGNAKLQPFYLVIHEQLTVPDIEIREKAIFSAARTFDAQFINPIIEQLSDRDFRQAAMDALYHFGEPIMKILYDRIIAESIEIEDAIQAVFVIEKFASQKAIKTLLKLTEGTEHSIKIEAIDAIKRLKWKHSNLRIKDRFVIDKILDECHLYQNTLSVIHSQIVIQYKKKNQLPETSEESEARKGLIHLLEQRLDRQLQRIFRFLGIKYPPQDVDPILATILKGKEEQRIHAIEFLDNILDNQLKKELIPVAESVLLDNISEEQIKKMNLKVYSEEECYYELLTRKDLKLKQAVLYLIEQTHDDKFFTLVEMATKDSNEKIRNKASELLLQFKG